MEKKVVVFLYCMKKLMVYIYGYGSSTAYDLANDESNKNLKGAGPYNRDNNEDYKLSTRQKCS